MQDDAETIFLECLWQLACGGKKYEDFFGLPLAVKVRHPLRFSVAHGVHNQQMRSGWSYHPKSLANRDDDKNNMFIESYVANTAKHNFSDDDCNLLHDHFKTVNIPREYYDPNSGGDDDSQQGEELEITEEMLILDQPGGSVEEDEPTGDDEDDDGNDDDGDDFGPSHFGRSPPSSPPRLLYEATAADTKLRRAGQLRVERYDYFEVMQMHDSGMYSIPT